jgi:hypothetical protein
MNICACYIIYNEVDAITDSINSIAGFADRFVFIDGAFRHRPLENNSIKSTDGTIPLLEKLIPEEKRIIIQTETPWETEIEVRSQYFKHVPVGDWVFQIDADETVHGDKQQARRELTDTKSNVFAALTEGFGPTWEGSCAAIPEEKWRSLPKHPTFRYSTRFYRSTGALTYRDHHSLVYDGKILITQTQSSIFHTGGFTRSIRILNDTTKQSWRRYQDGLIIRQSMAKSEPRQRGA